MPYFTAKNFGYKAGERWGRNVCLEQVILMRASTRCMYKIYQSRKIPKCIAKSTCSEPIFSECMPCCCSLFAIQHLSFLTRLVPHSCISTRTDGKVVCKLLPSLLFLKASTRSASLIVQWSIQKFRLDLTSVVSVLVTKSCVQAGAIMKYHLKVPEMSSRQF